MYEIYMQYWFEKKSFRKKNKQNTSYVCLQRKGGILLCICSTWFVYKFPTNGATYKWQTLNNIDFKFDTLLHIDVQMILIIEAIFDFVPVWGIIVLQKHFLFCKI